MTREEAYGKYMAYGFAVLEHKWRYYVGKAYGVKPIADEKYDKIEANYIKLCKALGKNTYSSDMVGFDFSRPSCRMVHEKMCRVYNLNPNDSKWIG